MPALPSSVAESALSRRLLGAGLVRVHQGKVRDTYELPGSGDYLLVVATDRISAFDFVLPFLVPQKGQGLTALTVFWLTNILKQFPNHLVAYGRWIDDYLPPNLQRDYELRRCALVVRRLQMLPIECIPRGYLTGTALAAYQETGEVCGIKLPPGQHDGSRLPEPIFTVTTKAVVGHDEHLNAQSVIKEHGQRVADLTLALYRRATVYADGCGIIIPDTKFEYGLNAKTHGPELVLADEVLTPDSSRFWAKADYDRAQENNKAPSGWDKQPIRDAMAAIQTPFGVTANKLKPENPDHVGWVHNEMVLPEGVIAATSPRYTGILRQLIGKELGEFQIEDMKADD